MKDFKEHINSHPIPLIRKNQMNDQKGIYFPFNQIFGFEGLEEEEFNGLMDEIKAHILNEKYIYHHDWQDGDLIISEQWLTIHKRWPCNVGKRVLHRITMDYPSIQEFVVFSKKKEVSEKNHLYKTMADLDTLLFIRGICVLTTI